MGTDDPRPQSGGGSDPRRLLERRLAEGPPILLDGATGTELERRGVHTGLPLWSAHALLEAPDVVREIHADYALAGAEIVTANSFRTQRRALARGSQGGADLGSRDRELTELAVRLAREGASRTPRAVLVAGSAPTLEDCYRPDLVPADASLAREHARHAENLAMAGVDLILVETMNTLREAVAAARAARDTGLPLLVSFTSWKHGRLLSGEPLSAAISAVLPLEPAALLVNCLPPSAFASCLPSLLEPGLPFGVYANLGQPDDEGGFARDEACGADAFARHALAWVAAGARLVGGCCGTTPEHIRAIAAALASG